LDRNQFTAESLPGLPSDDGVRAAFDVADDDLALRVTLLRAMLAVPYFFCLVAEL
jgi:hypothetical protein